jgi:hypothetical protein
VAVVPGYVKCPKCHSELPAGSGRAKRATAEPGGTALESRDFPVAPFVAALGVAAAIIVVFSVRSAGKKTDVAARTLPAPIEAVAAPLPPLRPTAAAEAPSPVAPGAAAQLQDPRIAAAELETALRFQRLWGRVEIAGARIDLRSGSCSDRAMRPLIESKKAVLRGAGLTRLRCVEQSGAVVFEHDL